MRDKGFTLIELLIVVAIIAILAAIAVPNFLEAQVRAKVSRCRTDMRSMAVALEAYFTDHNRYPVAFRDNIHYPLSFRVKHITTPVAYIATIPADPFPDAVHESEFPPGAVDTFDYWDTTSSEGRTNRTLFGAMWRLASAGPDLSQVWGHDGPYDPSNGTRSQGDLILLQGGKEWKDWDLDE